MATTKQKRAAAHARAMKKHYHKVGMGMIMKHMRKPRATRSRAVVKRGGFLPGLVAGLAAGDALARKYKPVSALRDFGSALGFKLPDNTFGKAVGAIGKFATDTLGYGRSRRMISRKRAPRRRYR